MRHDIIKMCKSCENCQLKARSVVMNRVPIASIPTEETALKRMTMNIIGPIEQASVAGHLYFCV